VIVPSFSFIATANSVLFVNAKPVFADIEEVSYGLDPNSVLKCITPNSKAVIPMDYGGMSCKIREIKEITERKNLILIEDAAECLGSTVGNRKVGSIADVAIFSFCGNKVLTTGEGGALVTNSKEIYEKLKLIRSHGRVDAVEYFSNPEKSVYEGVGYNWRMSSMTAALGISQIKKLDKIIKMRQEHAKEISSSLSKHNQIHVPTTPKDYNHIYQMYTILLENQKIRDDLQKYLISKKIFCKIYFYPIHLNSFYKKKIGTKEGLLPITEDLSKRLLTLPIYPNMTKEEKTYLTNSVDEFFEKKF